MTALLLISSLGILVLGYVIMKRIDAFVARGGFTESPEDNAGGVPEAAERRRLGDHVMNLKNWSATRILTAGFAAIILLGALLLCLPFSNKNGMSIGFLDALFTSASATCVTGLVVFDTFTQFTGFGQLVILLLIQTGGLGFMTVAIMFSFAFKRRIGLRERSLLVEAVGAMQLGGVVRLVKRTLYGTGVIEFLGACLLAIRFIPLFGVGRGIWFSVFHAVSAFCNAGFDLMGVLEPFSSLTRFVSDPLVNLTIAALIVIGGLGFVVWSDLLDSRFHPKKSHIHTRAVLATTAGLIAAGTVLFLIFENNGVFSGMSAGEKVLAAIFQSVTPRTAGYNTVSIADLSENSKFLTMLLMFIGASPGSTGGGIKTTTFLVMISAVIASLRGHEDVSTGHYRLAPDLVRRAFCSTTIYLGVMVLGVFILCAQGQAFTNSMFECFSAIGTVGLTVGITPTLLPASKLAVILLMYTGRVGSLTVFLAVVRVRAEAKLRDPVGRIIVG